MVWEYAVDIVEGIDLDEMRKELNALGRDAWELVSAHYKESVLPADESGPALPNDHYVVILKRQRRA